MEDDGFGGFSRRGIVSQEVSEFDLGGSAIDEHTTECGVSCEGSIEEVVCNQGASGSVDATALLLDVVPSNSKSKREGKGENQHGQVGLRGWACHGSC